MKKGGWRACNAQCRPLAGSPLIHSAGRSIDLFAGSIFRAKRDEENGFVREAGARAPNEDRGEERMGDRCNRRPLTKWQIIFFVNDAGKCAMRQIELYFAAADSPALCAPVDCYCCFLLSAERNQVVVEQSAATDSFSHRRSQFTRSLAEQKNSPNEKSARYFPEQ